MTNVLQPHTQAWVGIPCRSMAVMSGCFLLGGLSFLGFVFAFSLSGFLAAFEDLRESFVSDC